MTDTPTDTPTDPVDRLPGLGGPRPLSPDLRARLADALLVPASRPLSEQQEESLTEALRDPVAERLTGLDAPRAVPVALRAQLQRDLVRRRRWQPVAAAVAAVAAAVLGVGLALPGRHAASPATTAVATPSSTALLGSGGFAGGGTTGGGTTGGALTGTVATATAGARVSRSPLPAASGGAGVAQPAPAPVTPPRSSPVPPPPPTVTSISPSSGSPGTWVTLTGSALDGTTRVTFGGVAATELKVVTGTEVRARAPQHLPGPVDVVLTTPSGSSAPQRYLFL